MRSRAARSLQLFAAAAAAALALWQPVPATATGGAVAATVRGAATATSASLLTEGPRHVGAGRSLPLLRANGSRTTTAGTAASLSVAPAFATLTSQAAFATTGEADEIAAFGSDQNLEPPDTMLAAGPTSLLQMINSTAAIWSKTGARGAIVDLNRALPVPAGWSFSDPRVLYDTASGRFFFTGLAFSANLSSLVFVAVSKSADPAAGWFVYSLAQTSNGELHDQPKIGVSDDKVVVSWNDFCCGALLPLFIGAETWVLQKSTLLTGATTPYVGTGPNLTQNSPVPAQSLTSSTTAYVSFNRGGSAGVLAITGTPAANNVAFTQTNVTMPSTSTPPAAQQPGGTIETNDDRFLSSVWRNGVLSVMGNTGCTPSGSTSVRSCARLVQVSTAGTPTLLGASDLGSNGVDVYYPAVVTDTAGNAWVAFTLSGATRYATAAVAEVSSGVVAGAGVFQSGQSTYGGSRWGDYSGISIDPTTSQVWAAAEYAATGTTGHDWGTAAGAYAT